ncbi:hypothetical protein DEO72_LG3g2049 [Vigna unguiculata]|uniref:Uncharacterized protein n=1 Tax=Vigna unguiculata TaxID=3917 RepID=A0A4D6LG88_VIGUN|nr:hypothetical protein DEO72_LG3g2049 [Vigna unguiculata]
MNCRQMILSSFRRFRVPIEEPPVRYNGLAVVRVAARCVSQIRGWPLFSDGGRVRRSREHFRWRNGASRCGATLVQQWWFRDEHDDGAGAGAIVVVLRGGRRRVCRLTREDGKVLVRVLSKMLDYSNELEWCDHGGSGNGTSGEEGGTMKKTRWLVHGGARDAGSSRWPRDDDCGF